MKALKIIGIVLVAIIALVLVLGIVAPKDFNVERSVVIDAPKEVVYAHVSNLKVMDEWSPWAKRDSNIVQTYEGTDGEVGSVAKWEGNEEVGKGMQEITELVENESVKTKLTFIEPMESECEAYFNLADDEAGTKVTWGFSGAYNYPMNFMLLFMSMDDAIGKDFEEGLASLKEMSEAAAVANGPVMYQGFEIIKTELPWRTFVSVEDTVKWKDMQAFYAENLGKVFGAITAAGMEPTGAPSGLYYTWEEDKQQAHMAAGVPVAQGAKLKGFKSIDAGGNVLHVAYFGAYEGSEAAHRALGAYMEENGLQMAGPVLEEYITDPTQEPDTSKWQTNIYYFYQ
jgi:effector-binding domain-containing protein